MQDFSYRPLTGAYADAWQALMLEGARNFPLGFLITEQELAARPAAQCHAILETGGYRGLFVGEKLIGFCGYRPQQLIRTRHRGEVGPFFITQSYHGTGAAKALMQGVMAEARANGVEQLELFVDSGNTRAVAFYERLGFAQISTHPDGARIDGQPRTGFFYVLRLSDE